MLDVGNGHYIRERGRGEPMLSSCFAREIRFVRRGFPLLCHAGRLPAPLLLLPCVEVCESRSKLPQQPWPRQRPVHLILQSCRTDRQSGRPREDMVVRSPSAPSCETRGAGFSIGCCWGRPCGARESRKAELRDRRSSVARNPPSGCRLFDGVGRSPPRWAISLYREAWSGFWRRGALHGKSGAAFDATRTWLQPRKCGRAGLAPFRPGRADFVATAELSVRMPWAALRARAFAHTLLARPRR